MYGILQLGSDAYIILCEDLINNHSQICLPKAGYHGEGVTMKRQSIVSPFGNELPTPIPEGVLIALVEKLRDKSTGDEERKDIAKQVLMGHIRLAISIVAESHCDMNTRHDLIQEVIVRMMEIIANASEVLYDNNITAYIAKSARWAIKNHLAKRFIVPGRTYRQKKKDDQFIPICYSVMDFKVEAEDRSAEGQAKSKRRKVPSRLIIKKTEMIELIDLINFCINQDDNLNRREYKKAVIRLKSSGYTDAEVADILEISRPQVTKLIMDVEKKFIREEGKK
jgi:DNA-directed RNA polymerase specialized sigma24 family protein